MNFGETKNYLKTLVNRKDLTDTLAGQFIEQSQTRIERRLRLTAMENFVYFSIDDGAFKVPDDMLQIIGIWSGDRELERVDTTRYLKMGEGQGEPRAFFQTGHRVFMRPTPSSDATIYMRYYAAQPKMQVNTDENLWSVSAVDALIYGAAELAGDYFEDERLARYADKFTVALDELQSQSLDEDFSAPMSISSTYSFPED